MILNIIGSVVGPHPYPDIVARLQSVISEEIKNQIDQDPDFIVACVGGGSNAMGAFYHYLGNSHTQLIGVEAGGEGTETTKTAATLACGSIGVLHASKSYMMQTSDGQVVEPHSISAGLDYPGIGPAHAHYHVSNQVKYGSVTDQEALEAGVELTHLEGILPA